MRDLSGSLSWGFQEVDVALVLVSQQVMALRVPEPSLLSSARFMVSHYSFLRSTVGYGVGVTTCSSSPKSILTASLAIGITLLLLPILQTVLQSNNALIQYKSVDLKMNRMKPSFRAQQSYSSESQNSHSENSDNSSEQSEQEIRRPGKKLVINEGMNRLHHINHHSSQDGPIEERSGEESGESGESGESKSEGSAEEDRDSNCQQQQDGSQEDQGQSKSDGSKDSLSEDEDDDVDYIECRIQKLQRDLESKMNRNSHKPESDIHSEFQNKPKSDRQIDKKAALPPKIKPDYTMNSKFSEINKQTNKQNKSIEKLKPKRRITEEKSEKAIVRPATSENRKGIERKALKQNSNIINITRQQRKSTTLADKKKLQRTETDQKPQRRPSREPAERATNKPRHGTSLSKERQEIYKLNHALTSADSLKLEQEMELLKVVESIRTKLKKSIAKKLKKAKQVDSKQPSKSKNSSYLMMQR